MERKVALNSTKHKVAKGKKSKRSEIKELLMLLLLNRYYPIGRYRLKEMMELSEHEGLVKQMLSDLQKQGYVFTSRSGCTLTQKGQKLLEKRLKALNILKLEPFDCPILKTGPITLSLHLQNRANRISSAMEARDIAIRGGATGATIIVFTEGKLSIPLINSGFFSEHPNLVKQIYKTFNLKENDVVAIISAKDEERGLEASITIADTLSKVTSIP